MSLLYIAWRNLMARKVQTAITAAVVLVGIAVTLSILMLSGGVKQGIARASEPFGLLIGSKGSSNQLVFNTIFLMDRPLDNLTHSYYENLAANDEIQTAVPFALGDQYKGYRLVGTSPDFFELRGRPSDPAYFQLREGRLFQGSFEAVIGAEVAASEGLRVGDHFVSEHGVLSSAEPEEHAEHPFTVVGIMRSLAAPSDKGIYVSMDSYWISHEHGAEHTGMATGATDAAVTPPDSDKAQGVTAILVKPKSYVGLMKLYQQTNAGSEAQAVLPGQTLAKLFDMMGSGEQVLRSIGYVILGMAGMTVCLALYGSAVERRRSVAILRAIGAGRRHVMMIVLLESSIVMVLGCILGIAGAYGMSAVLSGYIGSQVSIAVGIGFDWSWIGIAALVLVTGIAAGLVPALGAYRAETARYLSVQ